MRKYGYFVGHVITEWLREKGDDRKEKLRAPFTYVDRWSYFWHAPKGSVIDGASVPKVFWNLADPFVGDYRCASIIHDVYCKTRKRSWQDTHRMFYEAMRCAGVNWFKARVMYMAVFFFGPRW